LGPNTNYDTIAKDSVLGAFVVDVVVGTTEGTPVELDADASMVEYVESVNDNGVVGDHDGASSSTKPLFTFLEYFSRACQELQEQQ